MFNLGRPGRDDDFIMGSALDAATRIGLVQTQAWTCMYHMDFHEIYEKSEHGKIISVTFEVRACCTSYCLFEETLAPINVHKYDVIRGSHFGANSCTGSLHVQFLIKFKHIICKNEAGEFHNTVTPNVRKAM